MHGYDYEKENSTVLLYKRIKKFISKTTDETIIKPKNVIITYQLQNFDKDALTKDEKIVEQKENVCIVEGAFYNEFYARQRVLSFGSKCTVLSPIDFRNSVIEKLKEMKEVYNG